MRRLPCQVEIVTRPARPRLRNVATALCAPAHRYASPSSLCRRNRYSSLSSAMLRLRRLLRARRGVHRSQPSQPHSRMLLCVGAAAIRAADGFDGAVRTPPPPAASRSRPAAPLRHLRRSAAHAIDARLSSLCPAARAAASRCSAPSARTPAICVDEAVRFPPRRAPPGHLELFSFPIELAEHQRVAHVQVRGVERGRHGPPARSCRCAPTTDRAPPPCARRGSTADRAGGRPRAPPAPLDSRSSAPARSKIEHLVLVSGQRLRFHAAAARRCCYALAQIASTVPISGSSSSDFGRTRRRVPGAPPASPRAAVT